MGDTDVDTEAYEFDDPNKNITLNWALFNAGDNSEIRHAKCIENLDFIKFDWEWNDLARFHWPDLGKVVSEYGEELKGDPEIDLNEKMNIMRKGGLNQISKAPLELGLKFII